MGCQRHLGVGAAAIVSKQLCGHSWWRIQHQELFSLPHVPKHYNFGVTGQLSPTLFNESRFGFNRSTIVFVNPDPAPLVPGAGIALDLQAGLAEPIDIANSRSQVGIGSTWQYVDNLTWSKGKHTIQT